MSVRCIISPEVGTEWPSVLLLGNQEVNESKFSSVLQFLLCGEAAVAAGLCVVRSLTGLTSYTLLAIWTAQLVTFSRAPY